MTKRTIFTHNAVVVVSGVEIQPSPFVRPGWWWSRRSRAHFYHRTAGSRSQNRLPDTTDDGGRVQREQEGQ